jgi:hypothetical protein
LNRARLAAVCVPHTKRKLAVFRTKCSTEDAHGGGDKPGQKKFDQWHSSCHIGPLSRSFEARSKKLLVMKSAMLFRKSRGLIISRIEIGTRIETEQTMT